MTNHEKRYHLPIFYKIINEFIRISGKTKVPVIYRNFTLNQLSKAENSHRTNGYMIQNYQVNVIVLIDFYTVECLLILVLYLNYRILKMDPNFLVLSISNFPWRYLFIPPRFCVV